MKTRNSGAWRVLFRAATSVWLAAAGGLAGAATLVDLQHPLDEARSPWLAAVVSRFNAAQSEVAVRLVAGDEGAKAPLMLREVASPPSPGTYLPLHQLPAVRIQPGKAVLPELAASVADARGRLEALPIGLSTPVLFYNKAAFKAAGLDPEAPPRTWSEVQQAADKLFDAGSRCPFTTSWPAANLIEQLSAWHGVPAFTRGQAAFNGLLQVKHLALMASWSKAHFFAHFGRHDEADAHFAAGECGLLTSGSHLYPRLVKAGIDVGVARLPVHDDYRGAPGHTRVDGVALWVRSGQAKAQVRAAAKFVQFLLAAETQAQLAREGGFLPLGPAGVSAVRAHPLDQDSPQQAIALAQIKGGGGTQLARLTRVREVIDEELEAVWADRKPAKEALDSAVSRAQSERRGGGR